MENENSQENLLAKILYMLVRKIDNPLRGLPVTSLEVFYHYGERKVMWY